MKIIIDCRESKLIQACRDLFGVNEKLKKDIILETDNLLLGDIIIKDKDNVDILIIERKTIDDLVSSIKDGRYAEQSLRLDSLEHLNHNIIYLIEGNISYNNKQIIYSSMFSLNYYKGFSVFRTMSIEESAYYICNTVLKLQKEKSKKPYYTNEKLETSSTSENGEEKKYISVIKKKKNANITEDNFAEIILIQIPGISDIIASAIMKEFKTLNNLLEKVKKNPDILKEVSYENEKKQKRKLNKTCISNILKYLIKD
jgi:ERCC4-type nuclease